MGRISYEHRVCDCSVNVKHNLIEFKTIHRLYLSKVKLHLIFPDVSPLCNRCKIEDGTLIHSLSSCTKLQDYWNNIFDCLSKAFKKALEPDPLTAIGISSNIWVNNAYERQAMLLSMIIAKRLILRMWMTGVQV